MIALKIILFGTICSASMWFEQIYIYILYIIQLICDQIRRVSWVVSPSQWIVKVDIYEALVPWKIHGDVHQPNMASLPRNILCCFEYSKWKNLMASKLRFLSCHVDFSARDQKRKPSPGRSSLARCMFWRVRRIPNLKRSRRSSFRAKDKQSECKRRAKHKQSQQGGCRRLMNCVSAWSRASNKIHWRKIVHRGDLRLDLIWGIIASAIFSVKLPSIYGAHWCPVSQFLTHTSTNMDIFV